jgi:hypothetical protein
MSRFTVDLTETAENPAIMFAASQPPRSSRRRWPLIVAGVLAIVALIALGGGYLYWQSLKSTPQYSLASVIDAAKRDDKPAIEALVNIDSVVDDFVPQVTGKAVELYGKGLPPKVIGRLAQLAAPVIPAVKERARAELPRLIRERVQLFGSVPFAAMVVGAGRYLDIKVDGDNAIVTSKLPDHPLELKMRRNADRWQIVGVKDDDLAASIARAIGQDIIAVAVNGGAQKTVDKLGDVSITDILRKAQELVK